MERSNKKGFTIFEILIVIFLIGILSAILFFAFNSLDVIKRARDSKRINDLQALNSAIQILINQNPDVFLGEENIIYLSLPDTSSNCSSYLSKLPPLYSPFSYRCVNSNDFRKINGQGWLPLNFSNLLLGISSLPIDPLNNSDYFYAYTKKGNKYKITARMESENFALMMVNDGGIEPLLYEIGSDLKIPNPQSGLVLYLPFEEGTGTITYDLSGYNNNGTLYNFNFNSSSGWVKGKSGWGLIFDGIDDYVMVPDSNSLDTNGEEVSIIFWTYPTAFNGDTHIIRHQTPGYLFDQNPSNYGLEIYHLYDTQWRYSPCYSGSPLSLNEWQFVAGTFKKGSFLKIYRNGILTRQCLPSYPYSMGPAPNPLYIGYLGWKASGNAYFKGVLDEIRIYSRALSDLEIKVLYSSAK
jgi:prepilin-type N-terminal cleavage/methylation domain-containing protein